jgi:hypothetical protein
MAGITIAFTSEYVICVFCTLVSMSEYKISAVTQDITPEVAEIEVALVTVKKVKLFLCLIN